MKKMSDDIIGSITGTATFEWVEVSPVEGSDTVRVIGYYHGDTTTYQCDRERVNISGLALRQIHDSFQLEPEGDGPVWVEATEERLNVSSDKPGGSDN
jgi:hypothetical protein